MWNLEKHHDKAACAFDSVYTFRMESKDIRAFAEWCYKSFSDNFILIQHSTTTLAGGYATNRMGLNNLDNDLKNGAHHEADDIAVFVKHYELRLYKADEVLLLLKYLGEPC